MLRSLFIVTLTASVLVAGPAGADVYKYKDDKGNTQYTDKPATLPAERLNVQTQKTDTVAVRARQEADQARTQSSSAQRQSNSQSSDAQAAQLSAQDKAERCIKARERYETYMNSQKLFEQKPDGERRYLTSEELDEARASAKASMDVMCK